MNILFCSVGRRAELLKYFKETLEEDVNIVATDLSPYAPALYFADKTYLAPRITDENYLDFILDICKKEKIHAITTFIDPEIEILAKNREKFKELDVEVLAPYENTAKLCFDKYEMFKYLRECGIKTVLTYGDLASFQQDYELGKIDFPVFVKPRTGSGSVGARKVEDMATLRIAIENDTTLIIQEFMNGDDLDADVYIDTFSHKPVAIFTKKKISTTIGGANKTISFKDNRLFDRIQDILQHFEFNGPIDMDFFYKDGEYYISEINPRFGGAYLHAYGAGVNFIKLIENNLSHIENEANIGDYEDGVVMMMYDSVVICKNEELI